MSDLVERLREERSVYDVELCDEAADRIEELKVKNIKLQAERDALIPVAAQPVPLGGWEELDRLQAENAKLRKVYEAAKKVEPLLRGDPLIGRWQKEDIDLRKAIAEVDDDQ